jgi:hypothetical protein
VVGNNHQDGDAAQAVELGDMAIDLCAVHDGVNRVVENTYFMR